MDHVHQELDECGFPCPIVADESKYSTAWNRQSERCESFGVAVRLGETVSLDGVVGYDQCGLRRSREVRTF